MNEWSWYFHERMMHESGNTNSVTLIVRIANSEDVIAHSFHLNSPSLFLHSIPLSSRLDTIPSTVSFNSHWLLQNVDLWSFINHSNIMSIDFWSLISNSRSVSGICVHCTHTTKTVVRIRARVRFFFGKKRRERTTLSLILLDDRNNKSWKSEKLRPPWHQVCSRL